MGGNKVNSFYNNIIGKYDYVTIDIWMLKYFNSSKAQCNKTEYKYYSRIIKKYAKKLNMLPCECQAVIWEYVRSKHNKKPSNFYQYINLV